MEVFPIQREWDWAIGSWGCWVQGSAQANWVLPHQTGNCVFNDLALCMGESLCSNKEPHPNCCQKVGQGIHIFPDKQLYIVFLLSYYFFLCISIPSWGFFFNEIKSLLLSNDSSVAIMHSVLSRFLSRVAFAMCICSFTAWHYDVSIELIHLNIHPSIPSQSQLTLGENT